MGVTYQLLDKDKKLLAQRVKAPCFSEFPWFRQQKPFTFNDIAYINYQVNNKMSIKQGLKYLQVLKDIGFHIEQTPEEVLETGYMMCLENFRKTKHIYAAEIGGCLTAVRYLEEFNQVIARMLDIVELRPDIDKWLALQLAHLFNTTGANNYKEDHAWFGLGHCLFGGPWNLGNPYISWEDVTKQIPKSYRWEPTFSHWCINKTYGAPHLISNEQSMLVKSISIINDATLDEAILCIKSLSAHKATI